MKARLVTRKINNGFQVARDGLWVDQCCPFTEMEFCGTWCPAFQVAESWVGSHESLDSFRMNGHVVRLSCFPQPVEYEVEESDV